MNVGEYLRAHGVRFEILLHPPASTATRLAQCVQVPGRRVAKAVLLRSGSEYLLAVLAATHRIDLDRLRRALDLTGLELATSEELERVFPDCQPGALPALGGAFGLRTVLDDSLDAAGDIVIEGNTQCVGIRMRFADYDAIEAPVRARFADPILPRPARPPQPRRLAG